MGGKKCWTQRSLSTSHQMCHVRLGVLANVLHHLELFIVCLNCFPLNSPFIHFITSQRAGTLKRSMAIPSIVLNYSEAVEPVTACSLESEFNGCTYCSFHVFVQSILKHSNGACEDLLWGCSCKGNLLVEGEKESFPAGINKLSHHSASNMLCRQLLWLYLPVRLPTLCQLHFVFIAVDSWSCLLQVASVSLSGDQDIPLMMMG